MNTNAQIRPGDYAIWNPAPRGVPRALRYQSIVPCVVVAVHAATVTIAVIMEEGQVACRVVPADRVKAGETATGAAKLDIEKWHVRIRSNRRVSALIAAAQAGGGA